MRIIQVWLLLAGLGKAGCGMELRKKEGEARWSTSGRFPNIRCPRSLQVRRERIERKHGVVSPDNLLEESRPAGAVLHGLFEWDDTVAAEKFRAEQARDIIGNIAVVRILGNQPQEPVRAFVNIVPATGSGATYPL